MARRSCANCVHSCGTIMRVLVGLNIPAAICLFVFGATVERPINSFPPVAMLLMAFLALGAAVAGLVGGHRWACCLDAFLVLQSLDVVCKLALVAVLWVNMDGVVAAIDPGKTGAYTRAHVLQVLQAAKFLLLLFLLAEGVALVLAVLLRFWLEPPSQAFDDNFDEHNMQDKALSMQHLQQDVEAGSGRYSTSNNSVYNKISRKMAAKYGAFSHGIKWKRSWFGF